MFLARYKLIRLTGTAPLRLLAAAGALAALLGFWPTAAQAATLTVNTTSDTVDVNPGNGICADSGGQCSLRAAVMEANALAGADTIVLPAGDYKLTRPWVNPGDGIIEADAANGDLDLNSDITISGAGPATTTIEGAAGWNDGIIDVNSQLVRNYFLGGATTGVNVSISGVTIQGGNSSELLQNGGDGGAISVYLWGPQGNFSLSNAVIQNNYTRYGYGGGVGILNGQAGSNVQSNTVTISNTSFIGNTAFDAAGGGMFVGGLVPATITNCTFTNNRSGGANPRNLVPGGGGLYLEWDTAVASITGSSFSGNVTDDATANDSDGGGMATARGVQVKNSTFSGNTADRNGGGIDLIHTGALTSSFTNVTISGNNGYGDGAGIHFQLQDSGGAPQVTMTNVTIANNRADSDNNGSGTAGGLFRQATSGGDTGVITLRNSIVAGNFRGAGATASDVSGVITGTYNLFGTGGSGTLSGGTGNLYNVANPGLGALADNGGPVLTHALLSGSPALDAGNNALTSETTDARGTGFARKLDAADVDTTQTVDMGALEQYPSVENIPDKTMLQDTAGTYLFNLGDASLGFTSITATSSNTALVPNAPANLSISAGTGASSRNLDITPVSLQAGTTTITVTVTGVENGVTLTSTDTFVLTVQKRPDLTISKSHAGNFRQGDTNDTYSIAVSNKASAGPSLRPGDALAPGGTTDITVADALPAGLTPAAAATKWSGSNWSCSLAGSAYTCTYGAALAPGASSAALSLILDVDDNAGTPVTNVATVSGGAELAATTGDNSASDPTVITQTADLTVTKSHTDPFRQGETGDAFTIRVSNIGPGPTDATFTVSDTLPAGLTPTAATPPAGQGWTCSIAGQAVTCSRGAANPLANGTFSDITVAVDVAPNAATAAPYQLVNAVSVTGGGELASRTGNNAATDTATITQMPDLTIVKAANGTFSQGQPASYTMTVTNSGYAPTDGTAVSVTDALPAGLSFTSGSGTGWSCSESSGTATCTSTDTVAAGADFPLLTLNVAVADNAGSPVVNVAAVTGGGEVYSANSLAAPVSTTVVKNPDLTLTKSHSGTWTQGDTGKVYTLTVANKATAGPTTAQITVTDTLPADLTFVSAAGTGWTCGAVGQVVTCSSNDVLSPGGPAATITLTVDVTATAAPTVTNSATVTGGGELSGTLTDNTASDQTAIVQRPDLAIVKHATGTFAQGQTGAQYTITVTNQGTGETQGTITVSDPLPAGLTPTGASGAAFTCSIAGQTVTCTRSTAMAAGAQSTITLTADVSVSAPSTVTNTATVAVTGDVNATNDSYTEQTAVVQAPNLTVAKSHAGDFRQGQQGAVYTITVANSGTGPTDGTPVTVIDALPAGLAYVSATGSNWTCSAAGQTVTCTSTDVVAAAGTFPPITLTVNVDATAAASLSNTVTVQGGGELTTGDDSFTDPTHVEQAADLVAVKSHSGTWTQGDTGRIYAIGVTNQGAGPTTGTVTVTDTLPAGLTYVSAAGTGWSCSAAAQTVTCTSTDIVAANHTFPDITLTVDVAANAAAALTNTVTVSGGGEVITANDTASDATTVVQLPDLTIAKHHTGNFRLGQKNAPYTIIVTNAGQGATGGLITVADTLPTGLSVSAVSGTGWSCTGANQSATCTRSDALAGSGSYPPITLLVDVKGTTPATVINHAAVSGGGEIILTNDTADDSTTIEPEPPRPPVPGPHVSITAPALLTRAGSIQVTGTANPGDSVQVGGAQVTADAAGNWSATVSLQEGPNLITATSGAATDSVTVVRDTTPPPLTLTASATVTDAETVDLTATSEPDATVEIDGHPGLTRRVHLEIGTNTFTSTAMDRAGNTATATVTVSRVKKGGGPVQKDVDADQAAEVASDGWTFQLPAHVYGGPFTIRLQAPVGADDAVGKAGQFASVASIIEVQMTDRTDNSPIHQVLRAVTVRFSFDPAQIADPGKLRIFWYNPAKGQWVDLGGAINRAAHTIIVETDHFSLFGAMLPNQTVPPVILIDIDGHWARASILTMAELGVVTGFEDSTFRPENQVTRVEFAAMVARLLNLAPGTQPLAFTDADRIPDWAKAQVAAAVDAGIITGRDDGSFGPALPITRAEMAAMMVRALRFRSQTVDTESISFTDSEQIPGWARELIFGAAHAGLVKGYPDGTFRPNQPATRAEAVTMLDRLNRLLTP